MTSARPSDSWNTGDPYERYVGRWSHLVANEFLAWLKPPASLRWLDVGCGTGALTAAISEKCRPRASSMRASAFRCANLMRWNKRLEMPVSRRSRSSRSTFPPDFGTLTITGLHFSAGKGAHHPMPCRWTKCRAIG